jgi:NADH:ubiquinone reductase (non-electrogenic)
MEKAPGQSKWRSFLQILGRVTLITLVTGAGTFYYFTQKDRHPGTQLPFDPERKTIVVLGSGWGATSLLKTLDTTDYNVVSTLLSYELTRANKWFPGCC